MNKFKNPTYRGPSFFGCPATKAPEAWGIKDTFYLIKPISIWTTQGFPQSGIPEVFKGVEIAKGGHSTLYNNQQKLVLLRYRGPHAA
jgi:hypothetical protein